MRTPKWAEALILDALVYLEEEGHTVAIPVIKWRHGSHRDSSGRTVGKETIVITAGKDRIDAKLVILHELAHIIAGFKPVYWNIERAKKQGWVFQVDPKRPIIIRNMSHTAQFWDIAWKLYRWAKLPIRYCQQREYEYKAGAQVAYKRNRKSRC